jgi:hypothetical protein
VLVIGRGQNSLKTPPVWAYQGTMTCESMVRPQIWKGRESGRIVYDFLRKGDKRWQYLTNLTSHMYLPLGESTAESMGAQDKGNIEAQGETDVYRLNNQKEDTIYEFI